MEKPVDKDEYDRWMIAAERTLKSAQNDLKMGDYNWACFKAGQAAELAVEALLQGLGLPSYSRSISKLLGRLGVEIGGGIKDRAMLLDKLYIPTRYPDAWVEGAPHQYYTKRESIEAIKCGETILKWWMGSGENYRRKNKK